jgi:hypothetical protein
LHEGGAAADGEEVGVDVFGEAVEGDAAAELDGLGGEAIADGAEVEAFGGVEAVGDVGAGGDIAEAAGGGVEFAAAEAWWEAVDLGAVADAEEVDVEVGGELFEAAGVFEVEGFGDEVVGEAEGGRAAGEIEAAVVFERDAAVEEGELGGGGGRGFGARHGKVPGRGWRVIQSMTRRISSGEYSRWSQTR